MSLYRVKAYDKDADYTTKINEAVKRKDFTSAANFEKQRNAKIAGEGMNLPKTYEHIDVGNEIKSGIQNGASGDYIKELTDARRNKANTTPGLNRFANDEIQQQAMRYYYNDLMGVGGNYENRPNFESKYDNKIDEMLDRVMNGEEFSYDVNSDPAYQAYREQYAREGDRAMRDTMAQAAQNAGGMNSYAVSAAAQANNYYMQQLGDKVPELMDAAYQKYLNEKNLERQDLAMLQDMENSDYNRYLNDMNIYQQNVGLANDLYAGQLAQENYENENRQAKARELAMMMIQSGYMPPGELMAAAEMGDIGNWQGIADIYGRDIWNKQNAAELANNYQSMQNEALEREFAEMYGGVDNKNGTEPRKPKEIEVEDGDFSGKLNKINLTMLNLGDKTPEEIETMVENGELEATEKDGQIILKWATKPSSYLGI